MTKEKGKKYAEKRRQPFWAASLHVIESSNDYFLFTVTPLMM